MGHVKTTTLYSCDVDHCLTRATVEHFCKEYGVHDEKDILADRGWFITGIESGSKIYCSRHNPLRPEEKK